MSSDPELVTPNTFATFVVFISMTWMCSSAKLITTEGKVATAEDAARADADPPLNQLMRALGEPKKDVEKGQCVVYWMRMEDMRSELSFPPCRY